MKYEEGFGALLILIAAFFWGIAGGIGGVLIEQEWNPYLLAFYRGIMTLFIAIVWGLVSKNLKGFKNWSVWLWSAMAGLGVAGAFSLYFAGMAIGTVAVSTTLLYSAPVFVYLVAFLTGNEGFSWQKLIGLASTFIGIALLTDIFSDSLSSIGLTSLALGLGSGVFYAAFIFGFRNALKTGSSQVVMIVSFIIECVILLVLILSDTEFQAPKFHELWLFIFLGMFGGGLSFLVYIIGLRKTRPTLASLNGMAEPITAAGVGYLILNQTLTMRQLAGCIIVITSVTLMNTRKKHKM
ncbi:MAG: EamA family transporter [Bacteroidetes bacterium]|jgi:drug/metabolite transporter (DMT)-like permease|nr:EamA family transporter [Bacteroidota bacterium]